MTSIIIAALGVACLVLTVALKRSLDELCDALDEIARLTPLAEIGLRRVKAVEKYEAKHRGVTK